MNDKEFVIPQATTTVDGVRQLVNPYRAQHGTEYHCPSCGQVVRLRRETRDEGNRVTRSQHFAHTGESCGGPAKPKTAAQRSGFLFNPGDEAPAPEVQLEGPTLRVIRWKILTERPCLVKIEHGEDTLAAIRELKTLCERSCEEAGSFSARSAGGKEGYCMTCLSRVGTGVLR